MRDQSHNAVGLPVIHGRAAAIDIGARFHVVAVPPDLCGEPVRTFQAFTGEIEKLAEWLVSIGIETVAMESTGVYWVPVFEVLQDRGIEVVVANAREARAVPGRKSDVNDAQWLQRLHACGLLRASFRPERRVLCQAVRVKYAFIDAHAALYPVRRLCSTMAVHPSGYYAWKQQPVSERSANDKRVEALITQCWEASGRIYGYRKIRNDLHDMGEPCGKHRVARLMRLAGLRSHTGYGRRPGRYGGRPAMVAPNLLERQFAPTAPNKSWVTDITYIRTHEGWLYLCAVLDLFSRQVVGWSMGERMTKELALNALLMAVWRRKPTEEVVVHSDQGSQFSSHD